MIEGKFVVQSGVAPDFVTLRQADEMVWGVCICVNLRTYICGCSTHPRLDLILYGINGADGTGTYTARIIQLSPTGDGSLVSQVTAVPFLSSLGGFRTDRVDLTVRAADVDAYCPDRTVLFYKISVMSCRQSGVSLGSYFCDQDPDNVDCAACTCPVRLV